MNDRLEADGAVPAAAGSANVDTPESVSAQSKFMGSMMQDALLVVGRVLLSTLFIDAGVHKLERYAQTGALMRAHGVPPALLPLVIALELGGGLALALGALTRLTAAALAVFSVAAITIFLLPDPGAVTLALAELAMVGGLCSFAARGGGRFSIDRLWMRVAESKRRSAHG